MLQLIKAITENPADKTEVNLIFANVTPQDVLLKSYLDDLTKEFPRIKVRYTVDKPSADWKGDTGFVSEEMLKADLPAPGQGKVFICGPNPMLGFISGTKAPDYSQGEVGGILKKLGYSEKDVFKF